MQMFSKLTTKIGAAAVAVGLAGPALAAGSCDVNHVVRSGDTLSLIALAYYGDKPLYRHIYNANSNVIGPNPSLIEVGQQLYIPCINGAQTARANTAVMATSVAAPAATAVAATASTMPNSALPMPGDREFRIVVGSDWAPFLHEDYEGGGMLTHVVDVAMQAADGNPEYKIDFINDWGAHLGTLIADHAYDFSLAWFRPNCDLSHKLSEDSQFRCNNLKWSEPLFEQVIGYYNRMDQPAFTSHQDLFGKIVCRPSGYSNMH